MAAASSVEARRGRGFFLAGRGAYNAPPEVTVSQLEADLDKLQEMVGEAEAQLRALRVENARLRSAIESAPPPETARGARPLRQIVLESERQEIRTRLRNLIESL